jgi:hypothetical protein
MSSTRPVAFGGSFECVVEDVAESVHPDFVLVEFAVDVAGSVASFAG